MLNWIARRSPHSRTAREIYGSIVASARQETFFARWGVPDTREGRFEMLALHVALVMVRLGRAGPEGARLGRTLGEAFITDIDDNMREIGISDIVVPRKVKVAAAALFDRHRDYAAALSAGDTAALAGAIGGYISGGAELPRLDRQALARYVERLAGGLDVMTDADCCAGRVPLPWPAV